MTGRQLRPKELFHFVHKLASNVSGKHDIFRVGICVSGGPDSMALAYLLSNLKNDDRLKLELSGLIVDHRARAGSTREAEQVRQNLTKLGIESKILTMDWPQDIEPLQLDDFETQARSKRYEMLAETALNTGIKHLFLGHHQDDQVETVLMRLIRNQNTSLKGLVGMSASSPVPAGFGRFGVHVVDKGLVQPLRSRGLPDTRMVVQEMLNTMPRRGEMKIACPGGLLLQRPLLAFRKADLVATCVANQVPYITDHTNLDPTSSLRNAVRYLRSHCKLPKALLGPRVLELQQMATTRLQRVTAEGKAILSSWKLSSIDYRSGLVSAYMPAGDRGAKATSDDALSDAVGAVAETVTPSNRAICNRHVSTTTLDCLKRHTDLTYDVSPISHLSTRAFTYNAVHFKPSLTKPYQWTLSRQPMRPGEILANTKGLSASGQWSEKHGHASRLLLWDNRFWIRVFTQQARFFDRLRISPLNETLLSKARTTVISDLSEPFPKRVALNKILQEAAPGKIRFTLPVITYDEKLVALPSLQLLCNDTIKESGLGYLKCVVFYNAFRLRHVDLSLSLETDHSLSADKT